jgi:hypothetical protein
MLHALTVSICFVLQKDPDFREYYREAPECIGDSRL